jgi:hypothetical protein
VGLSTSRISCSNACCISCRDAFTHKYVRTYMHIACSQDQIHGRSIALIELIAEMMYCTREDLVPRLRVRVD